MTAQEEREAGCLVCNEQIVGEPLRWEGIEPLCRKCKDAHDDFFGQDISQDREGV